MKKLCLEQISPIFYVGIKWQIWVNLILSMFDEIGWFRMLKVCLIDDWLDQFVENVFGTIFPKLLMLAENETIISWWIFCLFDHWMTWNKWVMLNWSLIGLNFDLEQFSQIKVGLAEFNWIWNSLCFLYFDSLDEFNWFGKWWLWIQFDWNQIGLKNP